MFAFPIVASLAAPTGAEHDSAVQLMEDIMVYIITNGFYLIDVTGKPTTWGKWSPAYLNNDRDWSDQRGINALQILSWIAATRNVTRNATVIAILDGAYAELTNATNQYNGNVLNTKIEAPCDDNYSDDELTFLPYYTQLAFTTDASRNAPVLASQERTWQVVRSLRSDLWNAIYLATTGGPGADASDVESIAWNLQTWPLELVDWPTANSQRLDITIDTEADRFGGNGNDALEVLPANERSQFRWNGNPHDLDGGNGKNEGDPGAWLLPYWMARYHGLIVQP